MYPYVHNGILPVWAGGDKSQNGRGRRRRNKGQFLEELGLTQEDFPRHLPAYNLIKASGLFPGFDWAIEKRPGGSLEVKFANYPRRGGQPVALVNLVAMVGEETQKVVKDV